MKLEMYDRLLLDIQNEHNNWKKYQTYLSMKISQYSQPVIMKQQETQNFFGNLFSKSKILETNKQNNQTIDDLNKPYLKKIHGLYCFGGPGCGKTFLMDLFYESVPIKEKQRIHFNEFMLNIHKEQHHSKEKKDPIVKIALQKAQNFRLICLDEFQVTDIADALILKKTFETLISNNCLLVATSNRPPEDLYKGGLQRHLFLPFIPFLQKECIIHNMDSYHDYRQEFTENNEINKTFFKLNDERSYKILGEVFMKLTNTNTGFPIQLEVLQGRQIQIKQQYNGIVMFDFKELCEDVMGASDYIAICRQFHTIILQNVQQISMSNRNAARRFILLIDEIYNHKVKLYFSAQWDLMDLFVVNKDSDSYDEEFALERCKSRIHEMQSIEYKNQQSYFELNSQ